MTYTETIDYLYHQLPMFTRIGAAAYKKDLHNTIALCNAFANPEKKFKSIHIAGTNGKGSTSHMLAAIFQTAGYKTGLYTSPHLKDFRERIKVNGEWIEEQFVIDFVSRAKHLIDALEPSFFELTVVMAFEYFVHQQVDIAIIETGLGGRLDSTNVITPELSIITNIGWDHVNLLGDTLEKIAFEKAGIIKQGIPVVLGETLGETKAVFEVKALATNSQIFFAEEMYRIENCGFEMNELSCSFVNNQGYILPVRCDLAGAYQLKNIRTVLTAVDVLRQKGFALANTTLQLALAQVKKLTGLHGRWEVIREKPCVVLDVGHNEDGVKQIVNQLSQSGRPAAAISMVIGVVKDKEVEKMLQWFNTGYRFYFTNAHIPRALPAADLQAKAHAFGLQGDVYDDVNKAIEQAVKDSGQDGLIVVCGSVFVVGEVVVT